MAIWKIDSSNGKQPKTKCLLNLIFIKQFDGKWVIIIVSVKDKVR
jgi:hypothetical protein